MTQTQTTAKDIIVTVASGRAFSFGSQWGYKAKVEADGTVAVWDDVAGHYTRRHSLTPRQIGHVRAMARKQVR